ncbi:hypothetical protein PQJ75_00930 [Rhodoplanes sp. TEM]|uniref:Uncharacterized protein n=1 Tax=Rhodoplanes tepidamans TaxID=200616 RepID=A0ABT5J5B2_RHOTP|nr:MULTISPECIES: hypothetical protein [Rhodoplanes]MDC7784817.1 hypothetical protein [Rhodoplanes tepidamans]MDC7982284.1 hypothetical protein [Rhodoplanes sp. TEM]MDQ0356291.1 hypothetical protein [Rhodoplanes tepidamans]
MSEKTLIEINGVNMEVDLRYAKRVDELRIGDRVKVLIKSAYSAHEVHPGVIVGFEPFKELPTIVVAYIKDNYGTAELKFLHYNAKSDGAEIVAAADEDFHPDRDRIMAHFDRQIAAKLREVETIQEQRRYFELNFRQYWERVAPPAPKHEPEVLEG